MRIALLCNHPVAFSTIEALIGKNLLVGLATPFVMHEVTFRVQMIAQSKNLPFGLIDPNNKVESLQAWLQECKPDVVFVITFPYKIPEQILKIPKFGFFNWHTGILPEHRGPDPIFWEILNQDEYGGVTVHKMEAEFDTGAIAYIEKVPLLPEDTYGQHIQKLAIASKKATDFMLENFVPNPAALKLYPQNNSLAKYEAKPDFNSLGVDWNKDTGSHIKALTRAANPTYHGAITFFRGVPVHLLQVSVGSMQNTPNQKPGTIISAGAKEGIVVLTCDQKLLRLDVIYTEDGFFTGGKLASIFDIKAGEEFQPLPKIPNQPQ